jgi:hypothetical protein
MITTIKGKKYIFEILSQREGRDYCFFIRAQDKFSRRASCINNLNVVLSEFGVGENDPRAADSTWTVSEEEERYFVSIAKQFLSSSTFLEYLERKLDEDRALGEWANVL